MKREYVPLFSTIGTSTKLADLPDHRARVFYLLLLPQCDAWGRISAEPRQLCAKVWPLLGESTKSTAKALGECIAAGLVRVFKTAGRTWVQIPDWEDKAGRVGHSGRRGVSEWPDPPDGDAGLSPDLVRTESGKDVVIENESGLSPSERRGEEKRAEEKRERAAPPPWTLSIQSHPSLDTPEVHAALERWVAYRREAHLSPWKESTWKANLADAERWGPAGLVASIDTSIRKPWKSLIDPRASGQNGQMFQESPGTAAVKSILEKQGGAA